MNKDMFNHCDPQKLLIPEWLAVLVASLGLSNSQGESATHNLVKYD